MSVNSYTAATSFQLLTLEGAIEALGFFGITWSPEVVDHEAGGDMPPTNRLYAWTTNGSAVLRVGADTFDVDERQRKARGTLPMDPPLVRSDIRVLTAGLRQVRDRGFPLALHVGEVLVEKDPDLQWLLDAGLGQRSLDGVLSAMQGPWKGPYWSAHELIVRTSAHIGDMDVPLNPYHYQVDQVSTMGPDSMEEAAKLAAQRLLEQSA